ncbi:MAG TPA: Re/Si-specific NAD(P)(+) transhydrogenase subunit alpha [Myxococcaceae bacterium]|nr:Re/Si-specific NAD(P)(+) transhydrogenase subunit alpha [Myxococcaceae bacterium]
MLDLWIVRERRPGETRVAATPETVRRMVKEGLRVAVEAGAGDAAFLQDAKYEEAGARVVSDGAGALAAADIVLRVTPPLPQETAVKAGAIVIGFFAPHRNLDAIRGLVRSGATSLSMELVPRIARAQKMDALSSQSNVAGYKAVLLAASSLPKYFPLLMTAAGTIQPARVVILGGGVAGLQALATARKLGAVVEVSDVRPAVKEQVQSLGGKFIDLPMAESGEGAGGYAKEVSAEFLRKQQEIVRQRILQADVVITTALVPGRPAPKLVPAETVRGMRAGSVIVDLAAEQGGNCELTVPGETVVREGVTLIGHTNLPATVPHDASVVYARNVLEVVLLITQKGEKKLNLDDEIVRAMVLTHGGEVRHGPTAELIRGAA